MNTNSNLFFFSIKDDVGDAPLEISLESLEITLYETVNLESGQHRLFDDWKDAFFG